MLLCSRVWVTKRPRYLARARVRLSNASTAMDYDCLEKELEGAIEENQCRSTSSLRARADERCTELINPTATSRITPLKEALYAMRLSTLYVDCPHGLNW